MTTAGSNAHMREVRVSPPEQKFLRMLEGRGGEIPWNWAHASLQGKNGDIAKGMVANLINGQLVKEVEYATSALDSGRLYIKLTDQGHAVVERLKSFDIKTTPAVIAST